LSIWLLLVVRALVGLQVAVAVQADLEQVLGFP
jgi:hypothetical protein